MNIKKVLNENDSFKKINQMIFKNFNKSKIVQ